jgi:hypothetical protein
MQFNKYANVFNNVSAARTFRNVHAPGNVVVRIGRKFGVVKYGVYKKLKLRRAD